MASTVCSGARSNGLSDFPPHATADVAGQVPFDDPPAARPGTSSRRRGGPPGRRQSGDRLYPPVGGGHLIQTERAIRARWLPRPRTPLVLQRLELLPPGPRPRLGSPKAEHGDAGLADHGHGLAVGQGPADGGAENGATAGRNYVVLGGDCSSNKGVDGGAQLTEKTSPTPVRWRCRRVSGVSPGTWCLGSRMPAGGDLRPGLADLVA